jgi:multidrug resistance efflux pump
MPDTQTAPNVVAPAQPLIINRRSEEIDEILAHIPSWIIRWGNLALLLSLLVLLGLTWFIRYPDIIAGRVSLTSAAAPAMLVARSSGNILLFRKDKDTVLIGDAIAAIQSTANIEDVAVLKKQLKKIENQPITNQNFDILDENLQLGELQVAYNTFLVKIKQHKTISRLKENNSTRKDYVNQQLSSNQEKTSKLRNQISILEQEIANAQRVLTTRYQPLYKAGSISAEQLEERANDVLQKRKAWENAKSGLDDIQERSISLQNQKSEVDFQQLDKQTDVQIALTQALGDLSSAVTEWEQRYILKSNIDGRINYIQFVKPNAYISAQQPIAQIIPNGTDLTSRSKGESPVTAELLIATMGAGKVEAGQRVNIILDDYPKKEWGMLRGKVVSIDDISVPLEAKTTAAAPQAAYKVYVALDEGLMTTHKKIVKFKYGMQGNAEVVTKDYTLLQRIFQALRERMEQ